MITSSIWHACFIICSNLSRIRWFILSKVHYYLQTITYKNYYHKPKHLFVCSLEFKPVKFFHKGFNLEIIEKHNNTINCSFYHKRYNCSCEKVKLNLKIEMNSLKNSDNSTPSFLHDNFIPPIIVFFIFFGWSSSSYYASMLDHLRIMVIQNLFHLSSLLCFYDINHRFPFTYLEPID